MRLTTALFSYAGYLGILFASSLFAQNTLLDDHSDKTASNEFGAKWHYYDDAMGTGKDDRPQAAPGSEASVINVAFTTKARHAFGNPNDQWAIKEFTFTFDTVGNPFATMPFTFGEN